MSTILNLISVLVVIIAMAILFAGGNSQVAICLLLVAIWLKNERE